MDDTPELVKFSAVLEALKDLDTPFPPRLLTGFSDLTRKNLHDLDQVWVMLPPHRKVALMEDLENLIERDTLVNFDDFARSVITDPDPRIRVLAIRLLWECENTHIVPTLIELFRGDPDEAVRAASASLLGKFVLLGELDSIPDHIRITIVNNLLEVMNEAELPRVKQRTLESLGYSSHTAVSDLIREAFKSSDVNWISSALCAMGRSADEQWSTDVERMITSPDPEVQFEAIRAAGELELASCRDTLLALLDGELDDNETRLAVIWALSKIGGDEVKEKLDELLDEAIDEDEIEMLEKAIENLELSAPESLELMDFDPGKDADELEEELDDEEDEEDLNFYPEDDENGSFDR